MDDYDYWLKNLFSTYGKIKMKSVRVIRGGITEYSKSCGFVNLNNSSDAATAVMHGYELFGKMLIVRFIIAGASPLSLLQNYPWPAAVYTYPNQKAWWYPTRLSETQAYYSNIPIFPHSTQGTGYFPPDNGATVQPSSDIPSCADSNIESNVHLRI